MIQCVNSPVLGPLQIAHSLRHVPWLLDTERAVASLDLSTHHENEIDLFANHLLQTIQDNTHDTIPTTLHQPYDRSLSLLACVTLSGATHPSAEMLSGTLSGW